MDLPQFPAGSLFRAVGSRVTCNPPPTDTDYDILVYVPHDLPAPGGSLLCFESSWSPPSDWKKEGFTGDSMYPDGFESYRKGDVNLIITRNPDFWDRFIAATHVAKRLNLLNKDDRIALFQAVLYAYQWNK